MSDEVMIEQFHLCFYVPARMIDAEVEEIRRAINKRRFRRRLLKAVLRVLRRHGSSHEVRLRLSR